VSHFGASVYRSLIVRGLSCVSVLRHVQEGCAAIGSATWKRSSLSLLLPASPFALSSLADALLVSLIVSSVRLGQFSL
jgi:hypothetical protein